jgi:ribosomal protein S1
VRKMFGIVRDMQKIKAKLNELDTNNKVLSLKIKSLQELIFQYFDEPKPKLKSKRGKV